MKVEAVSKPQRSVGQSTEHGNTRQQQWQSNEYAMSRATAGVLGYQTWRRTKLLQDNGMMKIRNEG